jgi:hypothetical protein
MLIHLFLCILPYYPLSSNEKIEITKKLIGLTKMTLTEIEQNFSRVLQNFGRKIGVRQGDPLSTVLFNIVLEVVFRDRELQTQGIIYFRKQQVIAYADDQKRKRKKHLEKFKKLRGVMD